MAGRCMRMAMVCPARVKVEHRRSEGSQREDNSRGSLDDGWCFHCAFLLVQFRMFSGLNMVYVFFTVCSARAPLLLVSATRRSGLGQESPLDRSEERRVGTEGRSRWAP